MREGIGAARHRLVAIAFAALGIAGINGAIATANAQEAAPPSSAVAAPHELTITPTDAVSERLASTPEFRVARLKGVLIRAINRAAPTEPLRVAITLTSLRLRGEKLVDFVGPWTTGPDLLGADVEVTAGARPARRFSLNATVIEPGNIYDRADLLARALANQLSAQLQRSGDE